MSKRVLIVFLHKLRSKRLKHGNFRFDARLRIIIILFSLLLFSDYSSAQDTTWQQQLDGWVNDVYHSNLFLGGNFYTRISLADIDGDGDLDMFYGGGNTGSITYFENVGDAHNPVFRLGYEEFPNLTNREHLSMTCDVDFADLDRDGDLDGAYSVDLDQGGTIIWNNGTPQSPNFELRFGVSQGQSSVTLVDIDGDGDYDYFSGYGMRGTQIIYSENIGTPEVPEFVVRDQNYQNLYIDDLFNFDMGDIDQDGDYDLIACKLGGNVAYYENIGTPTQPNFSLVTDNFLPYRDTTDWLESPELADIDGDGDLDLFLAGGYNHLCYFENMGTSSDTQFVQRYDTTFFYNLHSFRGSQVTNAVDIDADGDMDFGSGECLFLNESRGNEVRLRRVEWGLPSYRGWFADMDNDGDYDYLTPSEGPIVNYFQNIGDASWPQWAQRQELFPYDGRLSEVMSVATGDIDNDGDQDLFVSDAALPRIMFYRNIGTPDSFSFRFAGDIPIPEYTYQGAAYISLTDMDADGDLDLFITDLYANNYVSNPLHVYYYRNDGTPEQAQWTFVTSDFANIVRDHRQSGMTICPIDIDEDGDKDLLFSVALGLQLYLNPLDPVGVTEHDDSSVPEDSLIITCYPNPSNSAISVSFDLKRNSSLQMELFNILGQRVRVLESCFLAKGTYMKSWDIDNFPSGIYFIKAQINSQRYYRKLVFLK